MKINKIMVLLIIFLISIVGVSAVEQIYTEAYSDEFSTESELGKSLSTIRTELGTRSCYEDIYWEGKDCDYTYFCYAVLPSTSNDISDALIRECKDVTDADSVSLKINQFLPPKGVLYYVTTFITVVNYVYSDSMEKWEPLTTIPTDYINAHAIRSVCPEGQMLDFDMNAGIMRCHLAKRACLDTMNTGLCTNVYDLWVLDKDSACGIEDGIITDDELVCGANFCADRPIEGHLQGDGICDRVVDLEAVDVCSKFNLDGVCIINQPNGIADEYDLAVLWSCWDDVLSANSKICDTLDVVGCFKEYNPVCVGGRGGKTYPNSCFAEQGQGIYECSSTQTDSCYIMGACEPNIVQCYNAQDCYQFAEKLCIGGSTAGISVMCLDYMCSFSGACSNMICSSDEDCEAIEMPCVGVYPKCSSGVCTIAGTCLTAPISQKDNIWDLISSAWNSFWAWINGLF